MGILQDLIANSKSSNKYINKLTQSSKEIEQCYFADIKLKAGTWYFNENIFIENINMCGNLISLIDEITMSVQDCYNNISR